MRIGFDLDNTIAIYDNVFSKLGKRINSLPKDIHLSKKSIANYLRDNGREEEWTKIQGYAYGPEMEGANPAPFFLQAIKIFYKLGHKCFIISHRTQRPSSGDNFDLHQSAKKWIETHCHHYIDEVFLEQTLEKKIKRINLLSLDIFIDDLEKVIEKVNLPKHNKILFTEENLNENQFQIMSDWKKITNFICNWDI